MASQWNEDTMIAALEPMLLPGETMEAWVYVSFYDTGFFASRYPSAGYLALTGNGRLVGLKIGLLGSVPVSCDLAAVTKVKIRQSVLQKLTNQTEVYLEYFGGQGDGKMKFTLLPKVVGGKLPHQTEHVQRVLDELALVSGSGR